MGLNGSEQGTAELAGELACRGLKVTVLSAGEVVQPADGSYEAVNLGVGRLSRGRDWDALAEAVDRESAGRGIDVVHSMSPMVCCDIYQPRGGTIAETYERYLAMPRGTLGRLKAWRKIRFSTSARAWIVREREFFRRRPMPVIIAMSQYVAEQLRRHYGVPDENIRSIFGAIKCRPTDADRRSAWRRRLRTELDVADETTLLLFVAQHFHQKGLGYLLEAMRRVESAGPAGRLALAVVGRDDPKRYREQAGRLNLSSAVHYAGQLRREEVLPYYAAADVLVLPTIYDSCSRTVLEAVAMGLPAITTRHNGAGELIERHETGVVISSAWAIDELVEAIILSTDRQRRAQWSSATMASAEFVRIERMTDELCNLYRELIENRS